MNNQHVDPDKYLARPLAGGPRIDPVSKMQLTHEVVNGRGNFAGAFPSEDQAQAYAARLNDALKDWPS